MAKNLVFNLDLYKLPLSEILQNHRKFYGLRRDHGEPMHRWLKRIQRYVGRCEFSPITAEFLTIDQFLCGLNSGELESIQSANQSWTLKQLLEYIVKGNSDMGRIEANSAENAITIDVLKPEPIEDDPLSETDAFVKTDEEFHEYIPRNEMELSVCNSTPAGSSLRVQKEQNPKKIHRNLEARASMPCGAVLFSTFATNFTADELDKFREIDPNRTGDSTFVCQAVRFLYKDDLKKLADVSVTGRAKDREKEKMPSTYYDLIKKLLRERLKSLSLYADEFTDRESKLNKLISSAISNLSRAHKQPTDV